MAKDRDFEICISSGEGDDCIYRFKPLKSITAYENALIHKLLFSTFMNPDSDIEWYMEQNNLLQHFEKLTFNAQLE